MHIVFTSGLINNDNTKDYGDNDYPYDDDPSQEYLNSEEYDSAENDAGEFPTMISKDSKQIVNEGDNIKLPCTVDKLGII